MVDISELCKTIWLSTNLLIHLLLLLLLHLLFTAFPWRKLKIYQLKIRTNFLFYYSPRRILILFYSNISRLVLPIKKVSFFSVSHSITISSNSETNNSREKYQEKTSHPWRYIFVSEDLLPHKWRNCIRYVAVCFVHHLPMI